jgi:hypothetical protein
MPQEGMDQTTNIGGVEVIQRGDRAVVDFAPGMTRVSRHASTEFSANIAETLDETEIAGLGDRIVEYVDIDIQSRADWDKRMDQAMELLGLRNRPLDDLPFDGASAVTYPLIGEAVVQFQARAIEEMFPSDGPVKTKIVGEMTEEVEEQADRVKNHMNYQMTEQDRSYFWHTDRMLFYLPLGGSAFKKSYYEPMLDMVVSRFVNTQDFVVPYTATDLVSATRYTHRLRKNESEMKKLMASGFYTECELPKMPVGTLSMGPSGDPEKYTDEADEKTVSAHPDDSLYHLYECHIDLELKSEQKKFDKNYPLPYVVTVERETRKVLSIRRNWKEQDDLCRKRVWFTHYRYLPGLGFYGFGLLHLIGSVAEATSGTIRALLDSAAFANMQGGFISEDVVGMQRGDMHIAPGVFKSVKGSAEDIRAGIFAPPWKEPSTALARLFEVLTEAGKSFSSSTEAMTGEAANTGPVGTTVALIEQGSKVFSGIHRRLHRSAGEEFVLRAELNYEFLDDQYPYAVEGGEGVVMRDDYDGRIDVIPVSDPNIFSSAQRIAIAQAMIQRASEAPDLYDRRAVEERFLKALRVPDFEDLLAGNETKRKDPVTENVHVMTGKPIRAFLEQDHDAHIATHELFLAGLNGNQQALEMVAPIMQAHLAEHYAFKYFAEMNRMAGGQLPPPEFFDEDSDEELPPEVDAMIAQMAAQMPKIDIMPPEEEGPDEEQEAFEREEARKDEAHQREQARKDDAHNREQDRKDKLLEGDEVRKDAAAVTDSARKMEQTQDEIERARRKNKGQNGGNGN